MQDLTNYEVDFYGKPVEKSADGKFFPLLKIFQETH